MAKAKGFFIVTASQYDATENVGGLAFGHAGKANLFCDNVQKYTRREAARILGLELKGKDGKPLDKDDPKRAEIVGKIKALPTIGLDILFQAVGDDNKPVGDPFVFDQKRDATDEEPE